MALIGAWLCAACQYSPDMSSRTIAYNRAVADSTNQLLLLNIVRASERMPTYYSRLEGNTSSMSLTPTSSLSLPLTNPRSFETDISSGAAGAVTGSSTKAVASLASIASSLGLQASEANNLQLQTLDDQKYQNGMMTPVPIKNIQAFQDEGYERDLLFMMLLSGIQVSRALIDPIDKAVAARCAELTGGTGGNFPGPSFARQMCRYIANDPYGKLFPAGGATFSLRSCVNTGGAVSDDPPNVMVHFNNDPARESRAGAATDPHPLVCFQILLDDLLVLGLKIGSAQDAPAELVDLVSPAVAQDPHFRAQMIQQNLSVRTTPDGQAAICRKAAQANGFTLTFTDPAKRVGAQSAGPLDVLLADLGVRAAGPANPAAPPNPAAACQQKNPGAAQAVGITNLGTNDDDESTAARPVKLTSDKLLFNTRSFEAMIYYLGETVRYENSAQADALTYPRILGRNPTIAGDTYYETMFYVSSSLDGSDEAVSIRDDTGTSYGIPKPCISASLKLSSERQIDCSSEYPDNESLQVLNFINQVWGLQKESVTGPSSPLVVVGP